MLGYASSLVGATLKTVALQVATTALNAAITMGASLIVSGIITAISNWIRQDEILAEKAETAKQKIDELNNNYKEHSQLVSDSAKRYAELAQGVDQLSGKNLSLNDDDYKEFLDLSNQLAEAFPTLSRHYDENGNAILQLSGNVDTIVGSLNNLIEAERALKNQEIADELPTVYKNANNKSDDYKKQIDKLKEQRQTLIDSLGDVQSDDFSKNFIDGLEKSMISVEGENLETLSKMKDDYLKILKDANIDYEELTPDYENKNGVDVPVRFNIKINSSEEDIEKAKKTIKANVENLASEYEGDISELDDKIQSVQDKNKANWSSLTGSIAAWLDTEDSYKIMSDDMQSTIQNIVNGLDWSELDFSSWEEAKQYIQDNILSLFQTSDGKDVLKKIEVMFGIQTQFNNGEITVNEYQEKLKNFLDEISTLAPDTQKAIKLIFGISTDEDGTTTSSVDTMVNNVKSKLKDEFDDKVGELSLDDLQVASKLEIPEGTLLSWDELKQKIEETKNAASNETPISPTSFEDAWTALDSTDDDAIKTLKKDLLEAAEAGQLSAEKFNELDKTEYFKNLGISADSAIDKINGLVNASTQLSSMSIQISKMSDMLADKKNGTVASASDLAGFDVSVRGLESWDKFEEVMGSSESSMEQCQKAANDLATEWVNDGNFLSNLTEKNKEYYKTQLDQMGVSNAQEIVTDALIRKHEEEAIEEEYAAAASQYNAQCKDELSAVSTDLTNATAGEITKLQEEGIISAETAEKMSVLAIKKAMANGVTLDTSGDIQNLANLAGAATQLGRLLESLAKIKQGFTNGMPSDIAAKQAESYQKQIEAYLTGGSNKNLAANVDIDIKPTGSSKYKAPTKSKSKSKSSTKKSKQEIDWIERKITVLNNKIDAFATKASDTWSSWTTRSKALNKEIDTTKELLTSVYGVSDKLQKKYNKQKSTAKTKLDNYVKNNSKVLTSSTIKKINNGTLDTSKLSKKDKKVVDQYEKLQKDYEKKAKKANQNPAADYYFGKANAVAKKYKLSSATIKKIKNGTIKISDYNEKMAEAIQKYQDYYDKGKDTQKAKKEAQQKLKELAEQQFEDIQTRYENKISKADYKSNIAQSKLDYAEATGHYATQKYYKQLINSANDSIKLNQKEADRLTKERSEAVKNGLSKESEEYYNMSKAIWQCKENVLELTNSVAEYNNSLRDLAWDAFDRQEEYIARITEEADFLIGLMDDKQKFDENGNITSYGKSAEGLHAVNANVYQQLADDRANEIARLDKEYADDKYNKDYLERREELVKSQREAINNYQSERQAIVSLVSDGYNAMSDALDKLIEKRKEALQSEKDLYSYQKSISEKTKNIAKLRKQLEAIQGDNSEETKAQIQKLKVSLDDAQTDLRDTEYDQLISDQEELMDKISDDFKDWINNRLKDTDDIVRDVIKQTNSSASEIKSTLETVTNENGTKLTTEMSNILNSSNGISEIVSNMWDGTDGASGKLTTIIGVLDDIKEYVDKINTNPVTEDTKTDNGSSGSGKDNSGSGSGSGNTSNNKGSNTTTTNKNTSSSSSSTKKDTNAQWAAKYLTKKKFTGNKFKLNKNSIVDRLKYFDFDSSMSARTKYYKKLFNAAYSGSAAQNNKLIAEMKKHGFRNGGEIGNLVKLTGEDGFVLARKGEGILSTDNMDKIREAIKMSNVTLNVMSNLTKAPQIKPSNNDISQTITFGDIYMDGVNNPEQFAQELRKTFGNDTKTQKMFSSFIGNQLTGRNSMEFKKYTN